MGIEPKAEEPTRDLLGHAIRGEWEGFANVAGRVTTTDSLYVTTYGAKGEEAAKSFHVAVFC